MTRLIKSLDHHSKNNRNIFLNKNAYTNKKFITSLIKHINYNYNATITDSLVYNYKPAYLQSRKKIITSEYIKINRPVNSLNDLIKLIDDYPLIPYVTYNINMDSLHNIKPHLLELNRMVGMLDLKNNIVDQIIFYLQNLHLNGGPDFKHTILCGPPGTGKTEIAKIIGKIFSKLGILKKNYFKKVTRSDLIAGYLGQTALKTQDVIKEALGGVLFIDEAYALGNSEKKDSFAKECIDTLCEALSDHKDNLMVIVAGYETELNACFFSYNPGLKSRFPWIFKTDKYEHHELKDIFIKKILDINWYIDNDIDSHFFERNQDYFPSYGRDIEIFLLKTKIAHSRRVFCESMENKKIINNDDLVNGFELFKKYVNVESKKSSAVFNMYS